MVIYHLAIYFTIRTFETTILVISVDGLQLLHPERIVDHKVQKSLHSIALGDEILTIHQQPITNLVSDELWGFAGSFYKGEYHQRDISLKLRTRLLQLHLRVGGFNVVERLHSLFDQRRDMLF